MIDIYAEVIINSDAVSIDKPFTYLVKTEDNEIIKVGYRVKVPFRTRLVEGFIVGLKCDLNEPIKSIKKINKLMDEEPILSRDDLKIIDFLRKKYLCKYIDAIRAIIPAGIMKGEKSKKKKVISISLPLPKELEEKSIYFNLYKFVSENNGIYTKTELSKEKGFSIYAINKLIEKEILKVTEDIVYRYNTRDFNTDIEKKLNKDQENAVLEVINSKEKGFLIKGVTGSGKTEVYMSIVKHILSLGKSAIILVPEIALTPQMIERFKGRFGRDVALFHSRLSIGERYDEWFRIKEGKARLVVGARSAIFLPMKDLGIIIVDEEHENTYKSEQNPKYDTREVAEELSKIKNCKYVFASATPSIESYYKCLCKKLKLIELKRRVNNKSLPRVHIIDMRKELKEGNMSLLSRSLREKISETLKQNKQVILFLNRRGFSTFVSCRKCGYVFKCEKCDIAMTYHKSGYLVCHYCGRTIRQTRICPKCGSKYVKFFGAGTERVETEVKKYFKHARILRMDVDTTRYKDSHEKIYNAFKNHEADILIGTQMVSKGLDFKDVTLVGILAADMSLNIPDYRSQERTYQIVTQVSGRAGRGDDKGEVLVQTYTPESKILKYAAINDYDSMFNDEIKIRKIMNYPPFSKILLINCSSVNENLLRDFMNKIKKGLLDIEEANYMDILGPSPCIISKIKGKFRWQIIIKGTFDLEFAKKVKDILYHLGKSVYNEIRISIDINPNNMI